MPKFRINNCLDSKYYCKYKLHNEHMFMLWFVSINGYNLDFVLKKSNSLVKWNKIGDKLSLYTIFVILLNG